MYKSSMVMELMGLGLISVAKKIVLQKGMQHVLVFYFVIHIVLRCVLQVYYA